MNKIIKYVLIFSFISHFLFAATNVEIIDSLGRKVILPSSPKRVVICGRAGFMISSASFFFLTAPEKLISYSNTFQNNNLPKFFRLIDKDMDNKALFELTAGIEEIAALKPDLVLMKEFEARRYKKQLEQLNIPVVFFNLESPGKFFRDIEILGKIFSEQARSEKIIAFYKYWQKIIAKSITEKPTAPRCLTIFLSKVGGGASFNVPPKNWIQTEMIRMAGGTPVWEKHCVGGGWQKVSFEQIAAWDPEYIFVTSYDGNVEEGVKKLKSNEFWKLLRASKENKIFAFPKDFSSWDQPDSKWILGLYWLTARINRESYKKLKDRFSELYTKFYQLYGLDKRIIRQIEQKGDLL